MKTVGTICVARITQPFAITSVNVHISRTAQLLRARRKLLSLPHEKSTSKAKHSTFLRLIWDSDRLPIIRLRIRRFFPSIFFFLYFLIEVCILPKKDEAYKSDSQNLAPVTLGHQTCFLSLMWPAPSDSSYLASVMKWLEPIPTARQIPGHLHQGLLV